jgi:hypothetical protein
VRHHRPSPSFTGMTAAILFALLAFGPSAAYAYCCNIITTQSCAGCNIFMCACSGPCDCQNSCQTNCGQTQNACIADCTQSDCSYCNTWYHACMNRCGSAAPAAEATKPPEAPGSSALCEQIYSAIDADHNGLISKAEFVDFIQTQRKAAMPADGTLPMLQAAAATVAGQDPERVFAHFDVNRDGNIDRQEAALP